MALRKANALVRSQAKLRVVAPQICDDLKNLIAENQGECFIRAFADADVTSCRLVIAATDDENLNQHVSNIAKQHGLLVNVVDSPLLSNFIMPSIIDRDPITIAIGSSGTAPVLARSLRAKIETMVPAAYGELAQVAAKYRNKVKQVFTNGRERRRFWESVIQGVPGELVLAGNRKAAEKLIEEKLQTAQSSEDSSIQNIGEVYLVGAGPGDPDLLTFRALRLMQQADVVLYDRLVSDGVMDLVRRDAQRIYVGKKRSEHAVPQEGINQLLIDLAKQGKRVLRLKGGDPFIFGRGGEEIEQLAEHNIPFQVVPGITAASGCASYAGIPLTHRDYAQSVRFITGHLKEGHSNITFPELLDPKQTLVFYMALVALPEICQRLIGNGRDKNTPAALIAKGTTREQQVIVSDLENLPQAVNNHQVQAPTLVIIGDVVKLHSKLKWFMTESDLLAKK